MPAVDPFVPLREWRSSLYRGNDVVIDQFLDRIDTSLSAGWVRDSAFEQTRSRPDRIRCYLFDRPGGAAVRVWVQRVTTTRERGGPVQLLRHPPSGGTERIEQLVADFASSCVLVAAKAVGADHTRPAFGPRTPSHLTSKCCLPGSRTRPTGCGHLRARPKSYGTNSSPHASRIRSPLTGPSWRSGWPTAVGREE